MLSEYAIKSRARKAGYSVSKGFVHYLSGGTFRRYNGERDTGYNVKDLSTGSLVWGCYNNVYDHQWSLEDVDEFIRSVYEANGLAY